MLERLSRERICAEMPAARATRRDAAAGAQLLAGLRRRAVDAAARRSCSCSRSSCSAQFFLAREIFGRRHGARAAQPPDRRADRPSGARALEPAHRRGDRRPACSRPCRASEADRGAPAGPARDPAAPPRPAGGAARAARSRAEKQATGAGAERRSSSSTSRSPRCAASSPPSRRRSPPPRSRDKESQARIADLGSRLNVALAQRVQELARYRSDFFGRLRQILGNRTDVRIVGDRFVFQSEVLFSERGQAILKPEATGELDRIAGALVELEKQIPPDIPWVLRVDGHTDARPIATPQFPSNWALSAAARDRGRAVPDPEGHPAAAPRRGGLRRVPAARPRRRPTKPTPATAASSSS